MRFLIFIYGKSRMKRTQLVRDKKQGSMVKRLRHRPFTAVTGVQIPLESLRNSYADVAQFSRNKDCVHDGNIRRTNACINVRLMFSSHRRLHRERENEVFERHAIGKIHMPMWLNWQSS